MRAFITRFFIITFFLFDMSLWRNLADMKFDYWKHLVGAVVYFTRVFSPNK